MARVMACYIQPSSETLDHLEKLAANRHYADCKPALEVALDLLKSSDTDGKALVHRLVPMLYSRPYLTRLIVA